MQQQTVVAVFDRLEEAQEAREALLEQGFSSGQVRISSAESMGRDTSFESTDTTHMTLGQRIAHFFGLDDDSDDTSTYSEAMNRGSSVVAVYVDDEDEAERATNVFGRFDPIDLDQRASEWEASGWQRPALDRDQSSATERAIPVVEEQLQVGKRVVEGGGVRIFSRTREIPVEESVELREEHATISRRPTDRPVTDADRPFEPQTLEVRETREEPVVAKTARVVEEVVVGKETRRREERVRDTVRRTDVEVQRAAEQDPQSKPQRE